MFFLFLTSCLELHTAPGPGLQSCCSGWPQPPGSKPHMQIPAEPFNHHASCHASRHTSIPQGTGREERSGGTCPFLHLPWLLPILLHSIPQQLEVHFHQAVTDTRRCGLSTGCAPDCTAQPSSASPPAGPPTHAWVTAPTSTEPPPRAHPTWRTQAATPGKAAVG